jgi:hypothetical protein
MLKRVFVKVHIIVVVIGIHKVLVKFGEYISRTNAGFGQ